MRSKHKHIESFELDRIIDDFKMDQYTDGLVSIQSNSQSIQNILHKPFRSKHYEILLVPKGSVTIRINMFTYHVAANQILSVSANAIKEFVEVEEGTEINAMLFTQQYILNSTISQIFREAFSLHTTQTHYFSDVAPNDFKDLIHIFYVMHRHLQQKDKILSSTLLFFSLLNMIGEWISQQQKSKQTKNRKAELVIQFFRLLPQHISVHRDVDYYAKQLHVNPNYLSTTLKEKVGKTASHLIADMVIQEAKVLLSNPSLSISSIAAKLNFPDQFTFSKYFKRHNGSTPTDYRNE